MNAEVTVRVTAATRDALNRLRSNLEAAKDRHPDVYPSDWRGRRLVVEDAIAWLIMRINDERGRSKRNSKKARMRKARVVHSETVENRDGSDPTTAACQDEGVAPHPG